MAKKKIKKFLKKVAPLAIAGLGAAMLGNRRRNQANVEMDLPVSVMPSDRVKSLMTSDRAYSGKGYDDPIMTGGMGVKSGRDIPGMIVPGKRYSLLDSMGFKKGGRVGCGVAKKGFGKAMKKGKK
jgi:hypothetical protein